MGCASARLSSPPATTAVRLLGLDFGSTTTAMLVAEARLTSNSVTGRMEFGAPEVLFRAAPIFTPFIGTGLDIKALGGFITQGLQQAKTFPDDIFAGGAIVTGLAAERGNAVALASLVRRRIGGMVVATAHDPCLESWLAFMGASAVLSRAHPGRTLVNLDIGGGTTNPAAGRDGNVLATGCHFIGARHFQVQPGSYRLTAVSPYGRHLLDVLGIALDVGDEMTASDRDRILDYYVGGLEAIVAGDSDYFRDGLGQRIQEVPFTCPSSDVVVTFSGGVGELVYRLAGGGDGPGVTHYGDLGVDLARAILASPRLSRDVAAFVPENGGRATMYGLTLHNTEISGSSLFMPAPERLPLLDLPVVARIWAHTPDSDLAAALTLAARHPHGACLQVALPTGGGADQADTVRGFGRRLGAGLRAVDYPPARPLVLIVDANVGKTLGHYATDWGQAPYTVMVIDEIGLRNADFVNVGAPRDQVVPVTFFGMH